MLCNCKLCLTNVIIHYSGWNNENSLHQQSPSNGQQIPPGSLPQQNNNGSRVTFHDSSRFGNAREENNQIQSQQTGPAGIMQNPPPNLNQPPPKMVRFLNIFVFNAVADCTYLK